MVQCLQAPLLLPPSQALQRYSGLPAASGHPSGPAPVQAGGLYTYSIIQGNYVGSDTATTNLQNVDPLFRDAANGDYHLQSVDCESLESSPGIDAGDPSMGDYVLDCATAGLGTKLTDIGAYGGEGNRWVSVGRGFEG